MLFFFVFARLLGPLSLDGRFAWEGSACLRCNPRLSCAIHRLHLSFGFLCFLRYSRRRRPSLSTRCLSALRVYQVCCLRFWSSWAISLCLCRLCGCLSVRFLDLDRCRLTPLVLTSLSFSLSLSLSLSLALCRGPSTCVRHRARVRSLRCRVWLCLPVLLLLEGRRCSFFFFGAGVVVGVHSVPQCIFASLLRPSCLRRMVRLGGIGPEFCHPPCGCTVVCCELPMFLFGVLDELVARVARSFTIIFGCCGCVLRTCLSMGHRLLGAFSRSDWSGSSPLPKCFGPSRAPQLFDVRSFSQKHQRHLAQTGGTSRCCLCSASCFGRGASLPSSLCCCFVVNSMAPLFPLRSPLFVPELSSHSFHPLLALIGLLCLIFRRPHLVNLCFACLTAFRTEVA